MKAGKVLSLPDRERVRMESAASGGGSIMMSKSDPDAGRSGLNEALTAQPRLAAQTLGNIEYKQYCDMFSDDLAAHGDKKGADRVQGTLLTTLTQRNVSPGVLKEIGTKKASFA
jgi:hypothetical protein